VVDEPGKAAPRRARRTAGPITLRVQNTLGRDQEYEQMHLAIEGMTVAGFDVDPDRPGVTVAIPLPRAGLVNYRLEGYSLGREAGALHGEGCIRVREGSRFAVRRQPGSNRVFLEALRAG